MADLIETLKEAERIDPRRNRSAIRTTCLNPPLGERSKHWAAWIDDDYDTIGRGATEDAALADLREQMPSCDDCGAMVTDDGYSVDDRACFHCKP